MKLQETLLTTYTFTAEEILEQFKISFDDAQDMEIQEDGTLKIDGVITRPAEVVP